MVFFSIKEDMLANTKQSTNRQTMAGAAKRKKGKQKLWQSSQRVAELDENTLNNTQKERERDHGGGAS